MSNRITKPMNVRKWSTTARFCDGFCWGKNMTTRGERNICAYEVLNHNLRIAFEDKRWRAKFKSKRNSSCHCQSFNNIRRIWEMHQFEEEAMACPYELRITILTIPRPAFPISLKVALSKFTLSVPAGGGLHLTQGWAQAEDWGAETWFAQWNSMSACWAFWATCMILCF